MGLETHIRVRWGDMDAYAHVNNTRFWQYCETARFHYFEQMTQMGYRLPPNLTALIVTGTMNFHKQIRYPATVICSAKVSKHSARSFTFEHQLNDKESGAQYADASGVLVLSDQSVEQAQPLPDKFLETIATLEQGPLIIIDE